MATYYTELRKCIQKWEPWARDSTRIIFIPNKNKIVMHPDLYFKGGKKRYRPILKTFEAWGEPKAYWSFLNDVKYYYRHEGIKNKVIEISVTPVWSGVNGEPRMGKMQLSMQVTDADMDADKAVPSEQMHAIVHKVKGEYLTEFMERQTCDCD